MDIDSSTLDGLIAEVKGQLQRSVRSMFDSNCEVTPFCLVIAKRDPKTLNDYDEPRPVIVWYGGDPRAFVMLGKAKECIDRTRAIALIQVFEAYSIHARTEQQTKDIERTVREGVSVAEITGRQEVVSIIGENRDGHFFCQIPICRPAESVPYLGELEEVAVVRGAEAACSVMGTLTGLFGRPRAQA